MADLNVTAITNHTIEATDYVYGFDANGSKAPTVQDFLGVAPGVMAVGTCATAAATAAKAVTSDNWTAKPGQSILIEFTNANTANNVTLSINQGTAIPVYYLNCATEQISGNAIPAGAVIFTLNAAGTKFYAHLTKTLSVVDTTSKLPVDSIGVNNILYEYGKFYSISGIRLSPNTPVEIDISSYVIPNKVYFLDFEMLNNGSPYYLGLLAITAYTGNLHEIVKGVIDVSFDYTEKKLTVTSTYGYTQDCLVSLFRLR